MKIKKFIFWQLKKWAPLFIVLTLIPMISMWPSDLIRHTLELNQIYEHLLLSASIIPFFVYSERFSKHAADAYKAFPTRKNEIRMAKMLIGATFIAVLTFVLYWITVLLNIPDGGVAPGFAWHIVAFLYTLVAVLSTYFFNCTMVSFGNTIVTSAIYYSCGSVLMSLGFTGLLYVLCPFGLSTDVVNTFMDASGILADNQMLVSVFQTLIKGNKVYAEKTAYYVVLIVMFLIRMAVGSLAFFLKEPSGEYYSIPGARNEKEKCILYVTIGLTVAVIGVVIGDILSFGALDFLFTGLMIISVYVYFVLFNKRFTLTGVEAIVLGSLFGLHLLLKVLAHTTM